MAQINKKVAIIGLVIIIGLVGLLGSALFLQSWRKSPSRHVSKAEAILKEVSGQPIDLENDDLVEKYHKAAGRYVAAFANTKDVEEQVGYLNEAIEVFRQVNAWDSIVGCWNKMVTVDSTNWEARRNIIDYLRKRAESGELYLWPEIEKNITDFIEAKQRAGIESDPYLGFLKGKALYFKANVTADSKVTLQKAVELMEKGIDESEGKATAEDYNYLARAILDLGNIDADAGVLNAVEKSKAKAHEVLAGYIQENPNDPNGFIHDLSIEFTGGKDHLETLEPEILELSEKFPSSPEVYYSLANYYNALGNKSEALKMAKKASEFAPKKIDYLMAVSKLAFDKYTIKGDDEAKELALEMGKKALENPDAQLTAAITKNANQRRKLNIHSMLAQFYIELAMKDELENQKEENLAKAQRNIHEIKQIINSPESPVVLKWDGLYNLAEGNTAEAKVILYKAYERLKTAEESDAFISYNLAKLFENTNERGLFLEFINDALSQQDFLMTRPDVLLDFIKVLINISPSSALNVINTYETLFDSSDEVEVLKFNALVASNQIEKAEDILSGFEESDPNKIIGRTAILAHNISQNRVTATGLQQKINSGDQESAAALKSVEKTIEDLSQERFDLIGEVIETQPDKLPLNIYGDYFNYYFNKGEFEKAKQAANIFAKLYPENVAVKVQLKQLEEPDPANISQDKQRELTTQAFEELSDPLRRSLTLGEYYLRTGEKDKAVEKFEEAISIEPDNSTALVNLFDIALNEKDVERLEELASECEKYNIDGCQGLSFKARIDTVNEDYQKGIEKLNKCIEENPFSSLLYYLRSKLNVQVGEYELAVNDALKTLKGNPLNSEYSKNLALILYQRNEKIGNDVSTEQAVETRNAIQRALSQNPNDSQLLSLYVDVTGETEPDKAIAILQSMQREMNAVQNDLQIALLSIKLATESSSSVSEYYKEPLFEIAQVSLERVLKAEPDNQDAIKLYTRLLQETGRANEAVSLLQEDESLLWQFYYQEGNYAKAKEVLDKLYLADPKEEIVLNGLLLIAEKQGSAEDVVKYSQELIDVNPDNFQSQLMQVRSYIEVNLLDQAKSKIDSLKARGKTDAKLYLLDALVSLKKSRLNEALEITNKALVSDPSNAQGWSLKGKINMELGNFEKAIEDLKKSKALNATADTRLNLARAYLEADQRRNAIAELESAVENPQAPTMAWLLLEDVHRKSNNSLDINRFYEKAINNLPESPFWYNRYAQYCNENKNYDMALDIYEKAWELDKSENNTAAFNGYLNTLIDQGKYNDAISFASRYIDSDFSVSSLLFIGYAKYESGDKAAGQEFLNKAFDRSQDQYHLIVNSINFINNNIDEEVTESMVEQRYDQNPQSSPLNFAMYTINLQNKQYKKALGFIDQAISLEDSEVNQNKLKSLRITALQQAFADTKSEEFFGDLIAAYKKALEVNPNNAEVLNNLAYLLASKDMEIETAMEYAKKALELYPNQPGIMDTYAYVLIKMNKYNDAMELLGMAKQLFEKSSANAPADFYDHYGVVNEKLGNKEIALVAYQKALDVNESSLSENDIARIESSIESLRNQ